ncbi:MAG: flotillin family protein, partial [Candidatus Riflebacteria bacterium]|nr:flotillin family protein [Candidatus Riflebacteria bacterium]
DAKALSTLLMVEKIESIVGKQVEAIQNLKIDKITVWDTGAGTENGTTTANFVSNIAKALPPLKDIAGMAGVEIPNYLGHIEENKEVEAAPLPSSKRK